MSARPALVVVFLRGGADGLALVPPLGSARLRALRPTLAPLDPDDRAASEASRAHDLDGRFGLHPAMGALVPMFAAGELCAVHGVGTDDTTRSHFEAQDRLELGGASAGSASDGWLARLLRSRGAAGPLSAVAFGPTTPESLRGAPSTTVEQLADVASAGFDPGALAALEVLYRADTSSLGQAGLRALEVSRALTSIAASPRERPAGYPDSELGRRLGDAAELLRHRADLGVDVIAVDHGGWDSHFAQAELVQRAAGDLAGGVAAFRADLGALWRDVVFVAITEFGRRAAENVSIGTDHGRASCAFVGGGALRGRGVLGDWPGLEEAELEQPGDLRVTTDTRALLTEVVRDGLGDRAVERVFPGLARARRLGLFG